MNTNIYLIRHAHSIYSPEELKRPLSEKGLGDRDKVTEALLNENIDCVMASPYKRAIQTVEGVAKNLGMGMVIEDDFRERKISDIEIADFEDAMERLWTNYSFSFEGGESNLEAQRRVIEAVNRVLSQYRGLNIAIGTHGNIMAIIMNYFDEKYDYKFWKGLTMPDIYKLKFRDKDFIEAERIFRD